MIFRLPRAIVVWFFLLAGLGMVFGEDELSIKPQILADDTAEAVRKNPKHAEEIVRQAILDWESSGPHGNAKESLAAIVGGAVAALPRDEAVEALQAAMAAHPANAGLIAQTALAIFPEGVRSRPMDSIAYPGMGPGLAKVLKIQGRSAESVDASGRRESLQEGSFLREGTWISTGPATTVVLLFDNGTTIQIEPGGEFSIDRLMTAPFDAASLDYLSIEKEPSRSSTLVGLAEGTAIFHVAKLEKTSSFEISTPVGVAGIRGTAGFVQGADASGRFGLSSGSADFTTPNGLSNNVGAGESLQAAAARSKARRHGMPTRREPCCPPSNLPLSSKRPPRELRPWCKPL